MDSAVSRKTVAVTNPHGLHARPCSEIVRTVTKYQATVMISKNDETIDASSIFDLLCLAAHQGTKLELLAEGPDAEKVLEALAQLFASEFGVVYTDEQP
jgi:phosphocarrier protein